MVNRCSSSPPNAKSQWLFISPASYFVVVTNILHNQRTWRLVSLFLLAAATLERFFIYLQARALMIDEANLTFNIIDRSVMGLFAPLDHEQYAPPLFLLLQKTAVWVGGVNEYSLRLVPLLFSVLFLWWFRLLMLRLTSGFWATWAMLPAGFSWYFLRYSTEAKQYSSDMAIAVGLLYLAVCWPAHQLTRGRIAVWTVVGSVAIWTSMPAVFLLAAIGINYLWQEKAKLGAALIRWAFPTTSWLASFGAYYLLILQHDIGLEKLQDYHSRYFIRFNWWETGVAKAQIQLLQELHYVILPPFAFLILLSAAGLVGFLWRRDAISYKLLLALPILFTLLAAALQQFSLIPRVSLFLFPVVLMVLAYGWQALLRNLAGKWRYAAMSVLLLVGLGQINITYFWQRMEEEPIRDAIAYIQDSGFKQEQVIVHHEAGPAFRFYTQYHDKQAAYHLEHVIVADWDSTVCVLTNVQLKRPCWLLAAHTNQQAVAAITASLPHPALSFVREKAYAYFWP